MERPTGERWQNRGSYVVPVVVGRDQLDAGVTYVHGNAGGIFVMDWLGQDRFALEQGIGRTHPPVRRISFLVIRDRR